MEREPLGEPEEVTEYLRLPSVRTLYEWNYRGVGPKAIEVGRHLRYRWTDVDSWLESRIRDHDRASS